MINTFTDDEVRALLEAFDFSTFLSARNKLILAIAFDTGARNTEMCDILEEDAIDLLDSGHSYKRVEAMTGISKSTLVRARNALIPPLPN